MTPFDLHVLGTPPAFILSQDQTLILSVLSFPDKPWLLQVPLQFPVYSVLHPCRSHLTMGYCFKGVRISPHVL